MKSIYKDYTPEQLEEHFSHFLINSWSYSRVSQFARNEKAFEMRYIYNYDFKMSSTVIAGEAYHFALEKYFFQLKKEKTALTLPDLEALSFQYIEEQPANKWKIQKTTPTVESCIQKATKTVTSLLRNFIQEVELYDIKEVLECELFINDFLTINGVDIPLPANMRIDLVIVTNDDKTVIVDHKSKAAFSKEEDIALISGCQAITYVNGFATKYGLVADEVWFVENKHSTNRDGSPQLNCFKIEINEDTSRLYEALLYEPLRRMIQAVNDPDYVYLINESDNFVDKAELYDFWTTTLLAEVDDFNINPEKKELISKRLKKVKDASLASIDPRVIREFKTNASKFITYNFNENMENSQRIEHVLRTFGTIVNVAHEFKGYSSNTYLLEVSAGTKITNIQKNKLDVANALNVSNVRISKSLVVYEGKSYVSIEASKKLDKTLLWNLSDLKEQRIPIGKDNLNNTIVWDLNNHSTPHVLVCGATGSGKSVSIKSTIEYARASGVNDIYVFDPKFEFTSYAADPAINVYNDIEDIEHQMSNLVDLMQGYAKSGSSRKTLIVFDEFADAVSASRQGNELKVYEDIQTGVYKTGLPKMKREHTETLKSLEENLKIILQKGRSLGFRVIAATQRASTKVITGDAKVNFPVQICFRVPKAIDSQVVIDEVGAESLRGMGDGLIKSPEYMDVVRFQAFYKQ